MQGAWICSTLPLLCGICGVGPRVPPVRTFSQRPGPWFVSHAVSRVCSSYLYSTPKRNAKRRSTRDAAEYGNAGDHRPGTRQRVMPVSWEVSDSGNPNQDGLRWYLASSQVYNFGFLGAFGYRLSELDFVQSPNRRTAFNNPVRGAWGGRCAPLGASSIRHPPVPSLRLQSYGGCFRQPTP